MNTPEIFVVQLSNGDSALIVNDDLVYSLDSNEEGVTPLELGHSFADALGLKPLFLTMNTPPDSDWNWRDVIELLPPIKTKGPTNAERAKFLARTGYEIREDPDQPGLWLCGDFCDMSVPFDEAVETAWSDLVGSTMATKNLSSAQWDALTFEQQCYQISDAYPETE